MDKEKAIKKIIEGFFKKMTWDAELKDIKTEGNNVSFEIDAEDPEILIGRGGDVLRDIQYLLSRILSKGSVERVFVDADINGYKKKKNSYLEEMANDAADDATLFKKEKELAPMSSYERRIIHLALKERKDVIAESIGEGLDRRIVIKPAREEEI